MNKLREEMVKSFVEALDMEQLPWEACWNQARPRNAVTGIGYHGINAVWLSHIASVRGYQDPRWCTYLQAQKNGWQVMRGAKGCRVEYWMPWDCKLRKILTWAEAELVRKSNPDYAERYLQLRSRISSVFNGCQIEGIPEFKMGTTDIGDLRKNRDILITNMRVGYQEHGSSAYYSPAEDIVVLPPEASFHDVYGYMATLLHECGHATAHPSRLDRDTGNGDFGSIPYAKEELRAEIASAFTAQAIGLQLSNAQRQAQMESHMAYVQSWSGVLRNSPDELFRAIKDAEQISDYLIEKGEFRTIEASTMHPEQSPVTRAKLARMNEMEAEEPEL